MREHTRSRGAFATLVAVASLALVGMALAAMTALFAADARRTQTANTDAQLRQILQAGAASARDRLTAGEALPPQGWTVPLPPSLVERGGTVTVNGKAEATSAEIEMEARLDGRHLSQTLRLSRTQQAWEITEARLIYSNLPSR